MLTSTEVVKLRQELKKHYNALDVVPMFGRQDIYKMVKSKSETFSLYLTQMVKEDGDQLKSCDKWLNRMTDLSHPHILRIYKDECYQSQQIPYVAVKCEGFREERNLFFIKDKSFSETALIELTFQVGSALLYMEKDFSFIHGSINLGSIFLRSFEENPQTGEVQHLDSVLGFLNNLKSEQSAIFDIASCQSTSFLTPDFSYSTDILLFGQCLKMLMTKKTFNGYSMEFQKFVHYLAESHLRPISWKEVLLGLIPGKYFETSGAMNAQDFSFKSGDILKIVSIREVDHGKMIAGVENAFGLVSFIPTTLINLCKPHTSFVL